MAPTWGIVQFYTVPPSPEALPSCSTGAGAHIAFFFNSLSYSCSSKPTTRLRMKSSKLNARSFDAEDCIPGDLDAVVTRKRFKPDEASLPLLLDFSTAALSQQSIQSRFDDIAACLLHQYILVYEKTEPAVGASIRTEYDILEVEMYLHKDGCHEDPFTHADDLDENRTCGEWRFHKAPRQSAGSAHLSASSNKTPSIAGGYRGGTRKGLDLTLGSPHTSHATTSRFFTPLAASNASQTKSIIRGGVLFRSIRRVSDSRVISGPSLLVDELLRVGSASNIAELVQKQWLCDISAFPSIETTHSESARTRLFFHPRSSSTIPRIYQSPRIGLDLSHQSTRISPSDPRISYVSAPYRYFVHPELLVANGRGQTLLGVYQDVVRTSKASDDRAVTEEVVAITGLQEKTATKYLAGYHTACHSGKLEPFVGPAGKGAASSPTGFLRLMGAVKKFYKGGSGASTSV